MEKYTNEVWRDVEGYETMYQISNFGRILSLYNNIIRVPSIDEDGYLQIALNKNGKKKTFKVHRLVALHFISNPENKPTVDHTDCNKQNNHVSNLSWATKQEQIVYAYKNNLMLTGENRSDSKLTEKEVLEIRDKYVPWKYSTYKLAKEYGVCQAIIMDIINNKTWKHI